MNKYLLMAALCLMAWSGLAQSKPTIELSTPFTAANCYKSRILQCRNGNTFLFNYRKTGCDFLLYDKSRKMIKRSVITGKLAGAGASNNSCVQDMFETDSAIAIFLNQKIARKPFLYRMLISPVTGELISEQKIAELSKPKPLSDFAMAFGVYAEIKVIRDFQSGGYAVIGYDGFAEDTMSKLRVDLYNKQHQQLWSMEYHKLAPEHKYLECVGALVRDNKVFFCTHEWTTRSYGTEESIVVMSEIVNGKLERQQQLDVAPALKDVQVNMLYQPSSRRILMCLMSKDKYHKSGFGSLAYDRYKTDIVAISETDFSILYNKELLLDDMDKYIKSTCDRKNGFRATFCDWTLDEHGDPLIILEELALVQSVTQHPNSILGPTTKISYSNDDIGIIRLDKDGNQVGGYVVPHSESVQGKIKPRIMNAPGVPECDFEQQSKPLYENLVSAEFTSADFIHMPESDYLILNVDRKEMKRSVCDGYFGAHGNRSPAAIYTIKNNVVTRDYLFAPPVDDDLFHSAVIRSSHYSPETKTYAVVMTEQQGRDMVSHVAWIHF